MHSEAEGDVCCLLSNDSEKNESVCIYLYKQLVGGGGKE